MIAFLDTSAFTKLLVPEPGSDEVRSLVHDALAVAGSRILVAESRAALARSLRHDRAPALVVESSRAQCGEWLRTLMFVELDAQLAMDAGSLAERYFLHGMDAIQLASALRLSRAGEEVVVAAFDRDLREACKAESLAVFPA